MDAKTSVVTYCKAQTEINKIDKAHEESRKALSERIKTCRSLVHDELVRKGVTCFEVQTEDTNDPVYFRLRHATGNNNLSYEDIVHIIAQIDQEALSSVADKHERDLPKMVTALIQTLNRKERQRQCGDKLTLSISNNCERGQNVADQLKVSDEIKQVAVDLLVAKKELGQLRQRQTQEKKQAVDSQKEVEQTVKDALKATDPENMTSRVHMSQGEDQWVYYLRCKEKERQEPMGVRKVSSAIEDAVIETLQEFGLTREYNNTYRIDEAFWKRMCTKLNTFFNEEKKKIKVVSKLSLDKAAPKRKR